MKIRTSIGPYPYFKQILLLAGSFTFAFLLGEMVHELGHYLSHLAYGNQGIHIHLDPFGSSRIVGVGTLPLHVMGVTSAAGPLFNLILGVSCSFSLWRYRKPVLLPFLLWGPVAMIQEGVIFTLGGLTSGGDAAWMAAAGLPWVEILIAGTLLLVAGVVAIPLFLPLAGIRGDEPFWHRLLVVGTGFCMLMILRGVHSTLNAPERTVENLVPLVFAILLVIPVTLLQKPLLHFIYPAPTNKTIAVNWITSLDGLTLGVSMFVFQALI